MDHLKNSTKLIRAKECKYSKFTWKAEYGEVGRNRNADSLLGEQDLSTKHKETVFQELESRHCVQAAGVKTGIRTRVFLLQDSLNAGGCLGPPPALDPESMGIEMCTELLNAETGIRPTEKLELVG